MREFNTLTVFKLLNEIQAGQYGLTDTAENVETSTYISVGEETNSGAKILGLAADIIGTGEF